MPWLSIVPTRTVAAPTVDDVRRIAALPDPVLRNLRLTVDRPGFANDAAELLATMPAVESRASRTFPHAEDAIAGFQPNLNFARSYTTDLFNALGKLGAAAGYYDGNGHYVRASPSALNLFENSGGTLAPLESSQQFDFFGSEASISKPCPGGATQNATDGSSPYVNPPQAGSAVSPSECDPSDVPPGP